MKIIEKALDKLEDWQDSVRGRILFTLTILTALAIWIAPPVILAFLVAEWCAVFLTVIPGSFGLFSLVRWIIKGWGD